MTSTSQQSNDGPSAPALRPSYCKTAAFVPRVGRPAIARPSLGGTYDGDNLAIAHCSQFGITPISSQVSEGDEHDGANI